MKPSKLSSAKSLALLVLTFISTASYADYGRGQNGGFQGGIQDGRGGNNGGFQGGIQDGRGGYDGRGPGYGGGNGGYPGNGGGYYPRRGDLCDRREVERLVHLVYQAALGRYADPQGLNAFSNVILERGHLGLVQTATMVGVSQEFKDIRYRQGSRRMVRNIYRVFFNRDVDPSGMDTWTRLIDQDRGGEAMAGIVDSPEFYNTQLR